MKRKKDLWAYPDFEFERAQRANEPTSKCGACGTEHLEKANYCEECGIKFKEEQK